MASVARSAPAQRADNSGGTDGGLVELPIEVKAYLQREAAICYARLRSSELLPMNTVHSHAEDGRHHHLFVFRRWLILSGDFNIFAE